MNVAKPHVQHRSRIVVASIIVFAVTVAIAGRWYLVSGSGQSELSELDCESLRATIAEVQGARFELSRDSVCAALRVLASAEPIGDGFEEDSDDPWHYIARVRIQPEHSAWFLVFVARRSTGFKTELSLRHRRKGGWAVIGEFDGDPILALLGLQERIDRSKILAPESREVRDQRQPM
ncbi:MAG: hypothetical protein H7X80_00305 [bacterium]|nr:hypothetical protein [Candidatus Kapabacteria bacterium]